MAMSPFITIPTTDGVQTINLNKVVKIIPRHDPKEGAVLFFEDHVPVETIRTHEEMVQMIALHFAFGD